MMNPYMTRKYDSHKSISRLPSCDYDVTDALTDAMTVMQASEHRYQTR